MDGGAGQNLKLCDMAMDVRKAWQGDISKVVAIYNASISDRMATADTEPVTIEEKQAWFDAHNDSRPIYVAELEGEVVAWASFGDFYGRPAYHFSAELSVYVIPHCQRRGVGRRLCQCCIGEAPNLGITTILGFVFEHIHPIITLLRTLGFEQWGFLPEVAEIDGVLYNLTIQGLKVNAT